MTQNNLQGLLNRVLAKQYQQRCLDKGKISTDKSLKYFESE